MGFHKDYELDNLHKVCRWEYADAAARTGASGFVAGDIGKLAFQQDNSTVWMLTAVTPTWVAVSGSATALSAISDVTITSVADNELLAYDSASGNWINQTPDEADVIDKTTAQTLTNKTISTGSTVLGADDLPNTIASLLTDHDKAAHDALNIDADTLDTKHYSDISTEIDTDISTHAALTATHGVSGDIVGTTDTQTLSAKSFGSDTNILKSGTADVSTQYPSYDLDFKGSGWNTTSSAEQVLKGTLRLIAGSGATGAIPHRLSILDDTGAEVVTFDLLNKRIGINNNNPSFPLDIDASFNYLYLRSGATAIAAFQVRGDFNLATNSFSMTGNVGDLGFRAKGSGEFPFVIKNNGNLILWGDQSGGGVQIMSLGLATTNPSTNPTDAAIIYTKDVVAGKASIHFWNEVGDEIKMYKETALTTALTQITYIEPGTPDYAIQTLIDSGVASAWGFATQDEGLTLLKAFKNVQVRLDELESKIQNIGFLA